MSVGKGLLSGGLILMMGVAVLAAPGDNNTAPRRSRAGLTRPWNQLKDLTGEERAQIIEIHRKALDEIHKIEARERTDIMALLTDAQKKEVAQIEARDRSRRRPTTRPSSGAQE